MKKLASVILLTIGFSAGARQISPGEAMTFASDFMNNTELQKVSSVSKKLRPMRAPGTDPNAASSPIYVFNRGESDGFVIISGDDRAPKILGYSDKGSFDGDNLPPQLKTMMEQWATQMTMLPSSAPKHASWNKTSKTRSGEGFLMETAEWGQNAPFNDLCPTIDGQKAPAGCVATAMAIAMKYHNWPDCTRGGVEYDYYHPDLSFNFSDYSIDWNTLDNKDNGIFKEAAARLLLSAGVAATMEYTKEESSADVWPIGHALMQYYAYNKDCQFIDRQDFSDSEWINLLKSQLNDVGPVIYRGGVGLGHCFVVDGYDSDGLYHVNWGWDGLLNGYYTLDFSDVNGMDYSGDQGMIINMQPDYEQKEYSKLWIANNNTYVSDVNGQKGWNFSSSDIVPGEPVTVKLPVFTENKFIGYIRLAVVDENDNIVAFVDDKYEQNTYYGTWCPHPGFTIWLTDVVFPPLKAGERYQIVTQQVTSAESGVLDEPVPSENPADYRLVLGGVRYTSYFTDKGNRSEYADVNFHVESPLPLYFQTFNTWDNEFTIRHLQGVWCVSPYCGPMEEYTVDVKSYDKDGVELEGLYVAGYNEGAIGSYTITVSSPRVEVYIRPDLLDDTRRDSNLKQEEILESDGLIYRISESDATLIGYSQPDDETVIPDVVYKDDSAYNVVRIEDKALLYAPTKSLIFKTTHLNDIGNYAFAGMSNIESISFDGKMTEEGFKYGMFPFMKSNMKDIYLAQLPNNSFLPLALSFTGMWFSDMHPLYTENVECWISGLPQDEYDVDLLSSLLNYYVATVDALGSCYIPGLGGLSLFDDAQNTVVKEMWSYNIDLYNRVVAIDNVISKIDIERVSINGIEVTCDKDGRYRIPDLVGVINNLDVLVEYTVKGNKQMSTRYTPEYNKSLIKPLQGDSNNDLIVTVADAMNAANYIVGLPTTDFSFESTDVNEDGDITVSDITSIISLIPAQTYVKHADSNRAFANAVSSGYMVSTTSDCGSVDISLVSDEDLTALQFDIQFPAGVAIPEFKLSDAFASTHVLQQFNIDANTVRVVIYSLSGRTLTNNGNNPVVTLIGVESNEDIVFNNIFASDSNGASRGLEFEDLGVSDSVSVASVANLEVKANGDVLVVSNAAGNKVSVYAFDGRCVGTYAVDTDRFETSLCAGMYIVTVCNSSHRVIIK